MIQGMRFFFAMVVLVNGERKELKAGLSVSEFLEELGIRPARVVVELNRKVLPRERHATTILKDDDALEIVHFVGGGT
jgi:thiamine biosynthesis protein ThiS